ncbi:AMP-binding protein [Emticicia sp. CRIBPO]|uniref:AMP-binding protein n=1 Tax=Emticicia sp. CRIBPO TaxID=2683258 RepID=UPI0014128C12|nr:AMP-binding protein [Emticicia sp. CRIBPO]NBA88496.1 AMP-binding protein [Emticicia sp. CRIBPO]
MLFVSNYNEIINTDSSNPYYAKVLKLINDWESGTETFSLMTSGSTGVPKEFVITREQIKASIQQTRKKFKLTDQDLLFCCLNVEYVAGMLMVLRALEIGCELLVSEPVSNPFALLKNQEYLLRINRGKNFFAFVPMQFQTLLGSEKNIELLNTAKAIIVGGAGLDEQSIKKAKNLNAPVYMTYGMTETVTHVALQKINGMNKSKYFKVLDGVEIETDAYNRLRIRSEVTLNQWIQTNDIVKLKSKNEFTLIGRADNIINSGGVKIQLEKIEEEARKWMPQPARFFAYGLPDGVLGQKLILVIESIDKGLYENLKKRIPEIFTKFERPKDIFILSKFKDTPTGKIDKIKTVNEFILHKIPNF